MPDGVERVTARRTTGAGEPAPHKCISSVVDVSKIGSTLLQSILRGKQCEVPGAYLLVNPFITVLYTAFMFLEQAAWKSSMGAIVRTPTRGYKAGLLPHRPLPARAIIFCRSLGSKLSTFVEYHLRTELFLSTLSVGSNRLAPCTTTIVLY